MSGPNAELAYATLDYIEAHPEQHNQGDFVRNRQGLARLSLSDFPCGTTACFAGWTVLLAGHSIRFGGDVVPKVDVDGDLVDIDDLAAQLLGIGEYGMSDDGGRALFYEANNLDDVRSTVPRLFGPRPGGPS